MNIEPFLVFWNTLVYINIFTVIFQLPILNAKLMLMFDCLQYFPTEKYFLSKNDIQSKWHWGWLLFENNLFNLMQKLTYAKITK